MVALVREIVRDAELFIPDVEGDVLLVESLVLFEPDVYYALPPPIEIPSFERNTRR
jgi:hypothetical protein